MDERGGDPVEPIYRILRFHFLSSSLSSQRVNHLEFILNLASAPSHRSSTIKLRSYGVVRLNTMAR
jgi:hypothetical protein